MAKNKIDQINDAFIEILTKETSKGYENYLKSIRREMINDIDSLTPAKVKSIIQRSKIDLNNVTLLFMIQNAVLAIVNRKKPTPKQRKSLLPIIALLGIYSLNNPKSFVKRVVKINKGIGLNANEKKAQAIINEFKRENQDTLKRARELARKQLDKSQLKSKLSKRMFEDFDRGIKEKKSIEEIKNSMTRKYNKLSNVERMLDTELHAQSEYVRQEYSKALGYTHKIWKTQGDKRVRKTNWHNQVANKRIPIDSEFKAGGNVASQPGDTRLPPSERIRCRCYLIYE